jgi:hypothetical protein
MVLINVFLGAPGSLLREQAAFQEAVGACNEEQGLARGELFVALTVSQKAHPQGAINDNIRGSTYYVLAIDDTLGVAGNTFEHDWWVARECRDDPHWPMREAVALFKKQPAGRPPDPAVEKFRAALEGEGGARCFDFRDAAEFRATVRGLLAEWLA